MTRTYATCRISTPAWNEIAEIFKAAGYGHAFDEDLILVDNVALEPATTRSKHFPIRPTPAPRQVRRDAWAPSPAVARYRAFRDECKWRQIWAPSPGDLVVFMLPMPKSWSRKRTREADGQPHERVPDADNLLKALLDAVYGDDAHIWTITPAKVWSSTPGIYIERRPPALPIPFRL